MSEHTKEPWSCNHQGWCSNTELFENQRRIVACVNACQQLNTELLERITKNGGFGIHPAPQERIEELEQQRDDYKARALMYERTNAEQAAMLNRVIAERDGLLAALMRVVADPYFTELDAESQDEVEQAIDNATATIQKNGDRA